MRELPDQSVHCVVTSPPYWGLRDYGTAIWRGGNVPHCDHSRSVSLGPKQTRGAGNGNGHAAKADRIDRRECVKCGATKTDSQIGLEQSPDEYVAEMVDVFREVRRVLRDDGVLWLNMGDAYANGTSADRSPTSTEGPAVPASWSGRSQSVRSGTPSGLKTKDLIGLPWMIAFALRADGWWLRQDNVWAKRNCMPESVRDRTTRAHEMVFMLTKSGSSTFWAHRERAGMREEPMPDYRWVNKITREETTVRPIGWPETGKDIWRRINLWTGWDYFYDAVAIEEEGDIPAGTRAAKGAAVRSDLKHVNGRPPEYYEYTGKRNKRSVWHVATQPFAEAHFATMPTAIVETCVLAGSSERGCCVACGAPWVRQVEHNLVARPDAPTKSRVNARVAAADAGDQGSNRQKDGHRQGMGLDNRTTGWAPSCQCSGEPGVIPCTVLDPFAGAGTTALVADRLGRNAILIELNPQYIDIARRRLTKDAGMFAQVST